MSEPWAQVLLTAWAGIVVLLHVWAIKRDIRKRTLRLTPFTDNQFDQYAGMLQDKMLQAFALPSWLTRGEPGSGKMIFKVRHTETGELASVEKVPEITMRMEPVMHHEPAIAKSYGIIDPGGVGKAVAKAIQVDRDRRMIGGDLWDAYAKRTGIAVDEPTRPSNGGTFLAWEQRMRGWTMQILIAAASVGWKIV